MGKLHELLAVEAELRAEAQRALSQIKNLFSDGRGRLVGQMRKYQPMEEGGETFADEVTNLATTAPNELASFCNSYGRWMDAAIQKEVTNRIAFADVYIGDDALLVDMPATALLNLESKLAEIRKVYAAIPTNDPSESWEWNEQTEWYQAEPRTTYKTKKTPHAFVAYEATPEHPAQVEVFTEDSRVGTWTTTIRSGSLAPSDKREKLERLDNLLRAVKSARQRANTAPISAVYVAKTMFDYINGE